MFDYRNAVIYQIWPRSFQDSNGDGIGDLKGILSRLDYLKNLGIDAIWLSPVYQSPNDDYGYDISDYETVNPEFGTMADLEELIHQASARGIGIIMDFVANHTSTRHCWFQEALKDPHSPYRDYYFFLESETEEPPNNWLGFFGDSAWTKEKDHTWYLTLYSHSQADLNWHNPAVREEIKKIMNFWLDKGITGFRLDTINTISKAEGFPDSNPGKKGLQFPGELVIDRPEVLEWLQEIQRDVLKPHDAFAMGEGVLITPQSAITYTRKENDCVNMMYQFDTVFLGMGPLGKYDPRRLYRHTDNDLKKVTRKWMNAMIEGGGYIGNYLSSHDQQRQLSRFGDTGEYRAVSAKMLAMYNFTLYGTPFIYQGEEIGMINPKLQRKDWKDYECVHSSAAMHDILHLPQFLCNRISSSVSRDNARTPMQWSFDRNAGFSEGTPWMPVNPDYVDWNAERQEEDPYSVLSFYRRLVRFRHEHSALNSVSFKEINVKHPHVLAFVREDANEKLLVILNLSNRNQTIRLEKEYQGNDLLSNSVLRALKKEMKLAPYESHIFRIR